VTGQIIQIGFYIYLIDHVTYGLEISVNIRFKLHYRSSKI